MCFKSTFEDVFTDDPIDKSERILYDNNIFIHFVFYTRQAIRQTFQQNQFHNEHFMQKERSDWEKIYQTHLTKTV